MLRSSSFLYHLAILVVSFVCGVAIFRFIDLDQAKNLIETIEPRLLQGGVGTVWEFLVLQLVTIGAIVLLATHAFLKYLVRIVVAIRITFFGFSSVFLLQEISSIGLYATWWFPFQLVYSALFLLLCEVMVPTRPRRKKTSNINWQPFIFLCFLFALLFVAEFVVISTFFK